MMGIQVMKVIRLEISQSLFLFIIVKLIQQQHIRINLPNDRGHGQQLFLILLRRVGDQLSRAGAKE